MNTDDRVIAFIYLLLMEYLPVGEVDDAIRHLELLERGNGYELRNEHLAACATELAQRLT